MNLIVNVGIKLLCLLNQIKELIIVGYNLVVFVINLFNEILELVVFIWQHGECRMFSWILHNLIHELLGFLKLILAQIILKNHQTVQESWTFFSHFLLESQNIGHVLVWNLTVVQHELNHVDFTGISGIEGLETQVLWLVDRNIRFLEFDVVFKNQIWQLADLRRSVLDIVVGIVVIRFEFLVCGIEWIAFCGVFCNQQNQILTGYFLECLAILFQFLKEFVVFFKVFVIVQIQIYKAFNSLELGIGINNYFIAFLNVAVIIKTWLLLWTDGSVLFLCTQGFYPVFNFGNRHAYSWRVGFIHVFHHGSVSYGCSKQKNAEKRK